MLWWGDLSWRRSFSLSSVSIVKLAIEWRTGVLEKPSNDFDMLPKHFQLQSKRNDPLIMIVRRIDSNNEFDSPSLRSHRKLGIEILLSISQLTWPQGLLFSSRDESHWVAKAHAHRSNYSKLVDFQNKYGPSIFVTDYLTRMCSKYQKTGPTDTSLKSTLSKYVEHELQSLLRFGSGFWQTTGRERRRVLKRAEHFHCSTFSRRFAGINHNTMDPSITCLCVARRVTPLETLHEVGVFCGGLASPLNWKIRN